MSNKKPTLIAYSVRERGKGQKAIWTRIGAAWPHEQRHRLEHPARSPAANRRPHRADRAEGRGAAERSEGRVTFRGRLRAAPFHFHHQRRFQP